MPDNRYGLVNVKNINPNIIFDIRYATDNNFAGQAVYPSADCYLNRDTAVKLGLIQKELEREGLGLKIFDGYRPLAAQKKLWAVMPDERFVADPAKGSNHNRGCAVDLTLVDKTGRELPMPTEFDVFSDQAASDFMDLPAEILANREKLHQIMAKHGMLPLPSEWWHFTDTGCHNLPVLDVDFKDLENTD